MAGPIELSSADFLEIKQALVEYIESTKILPGVNFEGSNINVVLDVLAYQQQINNYAVNMISNESFLDSSVVRKNVVSNAEQIGYNPISARAAKSVIDFHFQLEFSDYPDGFPQFITVEPGMAFIVSSGRNSGIFNIIDSQTVSLTNNGLAQFNDVEILEGTYLTAEYTVNNSDYDQRFILENKYIDTNTIRVYVQENPNEEVRQFYTQADNLVLLTDESRKYWAEECDNGYTRLTFGDGMFGYKPVNGAKVFVSYLVTNGTPYNGITGNQNFKFSGVAYGSSGVTLAQSAVVDSASTTFGGADPESIGSIKFRAVREYAAQNRCVIAEDYDVLVRRIFPSVEDIYVFGGETKEIAEYGRVYITIKPKTGDTLSNITKNYIKESLDPFRIASIDIRLVDPDVMKIEVDSVVFYDNKVTAKDSTTIKATVIDALNRYIEATAVPQFGGAIRYSRIVGIVDDADKSITRNNTSLRMRKDLRITQNTFATYEVDFNQQIKDDCEDVTLYSTGFQLELEGQLDERIFYFENDPLTIKQISEEDERLRGNLYTFYFNEFNEKVRVSFYRNKFNELVVVEVLGDDKEASPFGTVRFDDGHIELGYEFKNGIKFVSTEEPRNIIEIRAIPQNMDIFAKESTFIKLDVAKSDIVTYVDKDIAGS